MTSDSGKGMSSGAAFAFGMGVGGTLLVGKFLPVIGETIRPVAKAGIKAGILGFQKLQVVVATASEALEDLTAEAMQELKEQPLAQETMKAEADSQDVSSTESQFDQNLANIEAAASSMAEVAGTESSAENAFGGGSQEQERVIQ